MPPARHRSCPAPLLSTASAKPISAAASSCRYPVLLRCGCASRPSSSPTPSSTRLACPPVSTWSSCIDHDTLFPAVDRSGNTTQLLSMRRLKDRVPDQQRATYTGSNDPIPITEPHHPAPLDARMAIRHAHRLRACSGIVQAEFLVSAGLYMSAIHLSSSSLSRACRSICPHCCVAFSRALGPRCVLALRKSTDVDVQ